MGNAPRTLMALLLLLDFAQTSPPAIQFTTVASFARSLSISIVRATASFCASDRVFIVFRFKGCLVSTSRPTPATFNRSKAWVQPWSPRAV